jgi:hypothetical protein
VLLSPLFLATVAQSTIYWGNPNLGFRVDRPAGDYTGGAVTLDRVRIHHCGGGSTDYPVGQTIDPVAGYSLQIAGGDHCSVTLTWSTSMDVEGDGSLGSFTVRYGQETTTVELSAEIAPVALTPYSVVSGSMSGGAPWLMMSID